MKYIAFLVGVLLVPSRALAHHPGGNHILVSPAAMDYQAGKEMLLEVRLSAPEAITSFRIHLRYDTALLEVREIRTNTDTFPFWWSQKAEDGLIELEASIPSPGFSGEDLIATVVVSTKQAGNKMLEVDEASSLLLSAQDENILGTVDSLEQRDENAADLAGGTGFGILLGILLLGGLAVGVWVFWRARRK